MQLTYDRKVTIATAPSIWSLSWPASEISVGDLYERLCTPVRTPETLAEFETLSKDQKKKVKDVGAFVGGCFDSDRRLQDEIHCRDLVTLDFDNIPEQDFAGLIESIDQLGVSACVHGTRKHSFRHPRIRIIIPASRSMELDEFEAVSRKIAETLGISMCDRVSFEPNQAMYWPSISSDGTFFCRVFDKPLMIPEHWLAMYGSDDAWRCSDWPMTEDETRKITAECKKKGDPRELKGMPGFFCKAYSVPEAIEEFLDDVYEPVSEARYLFAGSDSAAGARVYDDGLFLYSSHSKDPCYGHCYNAYDLVRIHLFGHLDKNAAPGTPVNRLPSSTEMNDLCVEDPLVKRQIQMSGEKPVPDEYEDEEGENFEDYDFIVNRKGVPLATIHNVKEILNKSPEYAGKIRLNRFTERVEVHGDLPWPRNEDSLEVWTDADLCQLTAYCESHINNIKKSTVADAVTAVSSEHAFHPVKDYLNSLPPWDGVERLDKSFIEYMGAEDTPYTRSVTRKAFTACVARIFQPGIKYDTMLLLIGDQGMGKSTFIKQMAGDWFCDSLTTFGDKESMEKVQNSWIIEIGELAALSKADVNAVKTFMTSQSDRFRPAYGRYVTEVKRHCVFFGTTNESLVLRDFTGNRRFWVVDCNSKRMIKDPAVDLPLERDLLWAEAMYRWQQGELLYVEGDIRNEAEKIQEDHRVSHPWEEIISNFLAQPVPDTWDSWNYDERCRYYNQAMYPERIYTMTVPLYKELVPRKQVCAMEIWMEALDKRRGDLNIKDSRTILSLIDRDPRWKYAGVHNCGKPYGQQRCYRKEED